jgi:ketosteroid isomerase-like protein
VSGGVGAAAASTVLRELQSRYEANRRAFVAKDFDAVMALRTEGFHSVTPDGALHDRAEMEQATRALLDGIDRWIALRFDIDSLEVSGDTARAIVRQHADRMALRADGRVHHVESWVTQRETWWRTPTGWKLHRVDGIRDQRRLVDGQRG